MKSSPPESRCSNHSEQPAVLACQRGRSYCRECADTRELRFTGCGYCPYVAGCQVQQHYRDLQAAAAEPR